MPETPKPPISSAAKFMLLAATLTFAAVRPRRAQQICLLIGAAALILLLWLTFASQTMQIGHINQVLDDGPTLLAEVDPPTAPPFAISARQDIAQDVTVGDIVIVFGQTTDGLFSIEHMGIAPLDDAVSSEMGKEALGFLETLLTSSSDLGLMIIAAMLVIFARFLLRASGALMVGATTASLMFVLAHWNTATATIAVPTSITDLLILAAGLAGSAIGYKASLGDKARLLQRLGGVALTLPLAGPMAALAGLPPEAGQILPVLAALMPEIAVIALAVLLLTGGLGLETAEIAITATALLGLSVGLKALNRLGPAHAAEPDELLRDDGGHVELRTLLKQRTEV